MTSTVPRHSDKTRRRILVFCDFYLPSRKGGGGVWTVANLVERFHDRYDFSVVTRNYESRNDTAPFTSVCTNEWNRVGSADVLYLPASELGSRRLAEIVNDVRPDGVFLNSFFSTPCVKFLVARRRGLFPDLPVVLAPCGELSPGAVDLKRWKKLPFILAAKAVGLHRNVIWKASTEAESKDIQTAIGSDVTPLIAPDLPPVTILPDYVPELKPLKRSGEVRLIFFSRISRKKNLDFLLKRLVRLDRGKIRLLIAGPEEDERYGAQCRELAQAMPSNIEVDFVGAVPYAEGLNLLTKHHFLVLPTRNENFGYVILEAMAAGCPPVISDRTIWSDIESIRAGFVVSLDDPEKWNTTLEDCLEMGDKEFSVLSANARKYATDWLADARSEDATSTLLERAFGDKFRF